MARLRSGIDRSQMMKPAWLRQQYYKTALQTFRLFRMKPNSKVDRETGIVELLVA
jgi:hypothetical protein